MAEFTTDEITTMLADARPDRYTAGDISWATDVLDVIAESIPVAEARARSAEQIVKAIEAAATRRTNRLMRSLIGSGGMPLDWFELCREPLSVAGERVALESLTPADLREFADGEEEAAQKDFASRLDAVKGARELADEIASAGCVTVGQFANRADDA